MALSLRRGKHEPTEPDMAIVDAAATPPDAPPTGAPAGQGVAQVDAQIQAVHAEIARWQADLAAIETAQDAALDTGDDRHALNLQHYSTAQDIAAAERKLLRLAEDRKAARVSELVSRYDAVKQDLQATMDARAELENSDESRALVRAYNAWFDRRTALDRAIVLKRNALLTQRTSAAQEEDEVRLAFHRELQRLDAAGQ